MQAKSLLVVALLLQALSVVESLRRGRYHQNANLHVNYNLKPKEDEVNAEREKRRSQIESLKTSIERDPQSASREVSPEELARQLLDGELITIEKILGSKAVLALTDEIPFSVAKNQINELAQADRLITQIPSNASKLLLVINPETQQDQSGSSGSSSEESVRVGTIDHFSVSALSPTSGMIFNMPECSNESDVFSRLPTNNAHFTIPKAGLQVVNLSQPLLLDFSRPIGILFTDSRDLFPIEILNENMRVRVLDDHKKHEGKIVSFKIFTDDFKNFLFHDTALYQDEFGGDRVNNLLLSFEYRITEFGLKQNTAFLSHNRLVIDEYPEGVPEIDTFRPASYLESKYRESASNKRYRPLQRTHNENYPNHLR